MQTLSSVYRLRKLAGAVHAHYADWRVHVSSKRRLVLPPISAERVGGFDEYNKYQETYLNLHKERGQVSRSMITDSVRIDTRGFCVPCQAWRTFFTPASSAVAHQFGLPDWREGLICPECLLNSRMRAAAHILLAWLAPSSNSSVYMTEQNTPLYRWVKARYPHAVGSEFLRDGTTRGTTNAAGFRHEDVTALSFPDASFRSVVSLEVLEHVPDFKAALRECARVLMRGGKLLLTAPFTRGPKHVIRARMRPDHTIEHLLEPEYHGDPIDPAGCLCFYHFGWELIDDLKAAGFRKAACHLIWSRELGYMERAPNMPVFVAEK